MFATPDETEAAFYSAFNKADMRSMSEVWLDDDSISCIHPQSAPLTGYRSVMASWKHILVGPGELRHEAQNRCQGPLLAIHVGAEWLSGADQVGSVLAVTNVFQFTDDGWRMLLHHASIAANQALDNTAIH